MKVINNRNYYIKELYKAYPILEQIDNYNKGALVERALFKELLADELLNTTEDKCVGFLFVISGTIKIQKINEKGEETNLYNIEKGQICHEALSCFLNCTSLNIIGRAMQNLYSKFNVIINVKEEVKHEPLTNRLIKLLISKNSKNIYVTHNDLAFELDSAREVISRKLKQLEKMGYLKLSRGKIQIEKDLNELLK